jgi:co-chaperonin GroES (HSP10)
MSVVLPRRAIDLVSKSQDPKAEMLKQVGDLSGLDVMYNMVLLASHIRPNVTKGGIIRPDQNQEEDVWQGKVGLVLKLGPDAFQDDDDTSFNGQKAEIGEWVVFKTGDAWQLTIGEWPCRLVRDSSIKMKVLDPAIIY